MWEGIWIPLITPFRQNQVDYALFERFIQYFSSREISGFVVGGSTGEGIKLLDSELKELTQIALQSSKKVVVGLSPASLVQAKYQVEKFASLPVEAFLVLTPFYYGVSESQKELITFYSELAEFSPKPILVYNMPKYTHIELLPEIIAELAQFPGIMGIKYSGNNAEALKKFLTVTQPPFEIISGNGNVFPEFFRFGGKSAILAIANILPESCLRIYCNRENLSRVEEDIALVQESNRFIVGSHGVEGIKFVLNKIHGIEMTCRVPCKKLTDHSIDQLEQWLEKNKANIIEGGIL